MNGSRPSQEHILADTSITEAFDALDTVREDLDSVEIACSELIDYAQRTHGDVGAELVVLGDMKADDESIIGGRRDYILRRLADAITNSPNSVDSAIRSYVSSFAIEEQQAALARAINYIRLGMQMRHTGPTVSIAEGVTRAHEIPVQEKTEPVLTQLSGTSNGDGRVWYSLTNPRTVNYLSEHGRSSDVVVASYSVVDVVYDSETEDIRVVAEKAGGGNETIRFSVTISPDDRQWRLQKVLDAADTPPVLELQLYLPARSASILEAMTGLALAKILDSNNPTTIAAILAARANLPDIGSTFRYPDGVNPRPVTVAKRA